MPTLRFMANNIAQLNNWAYFGAFKFVGEIAPVSGPSGTGAGVLGPGSIYHNVLTQVEYLNEGTKASPYWTPTTLYQEGLLSWYSDFRDGQGSAVAGTAASTTLTGSGIRIFGTAEPDATGGFTVAHAQGGAVGTMFCGTTTGLQIAMGVGGATVPYLPSTMGPLVIDVMVAQTVALTLRRFWCGFIGTAADALVSPATGATVTITNVQANNAGFMFDVGLTAATRLFATRNKGNDTPTILVTAAGVDTGVNVVAEAYNRLRVEVHPDGTAYYFIDKVLVSTVVNAITPATALSCALALHSTSAAAKNQLVKHFMSWGNRV